MPQKKRPTKAQLQARAKFTKAVKQASKEFKSLPPNMRTRKRFNQLVKQHRY